MLQFLEEMWEKHYAEKAFDLIKELERANESIPQFQVSFSVYENIEIKVQHYF